MGCRLLLTVYHMPCTLWQRTLQECWLRGATFSDPSVPASLWRSSVSSVHLEKEGSGCKTFIKTIIIIHLSGINTFISYYYHYHCSYDCHYHPVTVTIIITRIIIIFFFIILTKFNAVFVQYEVVIKDRNTLYHLAWTIGNRDPMHSVCIPRRIPRAWEQQE